jgi:transaldolase
MEGTPLQLLREYGQSAWIEVRPDDLPTHGELRRVVDEHAIRGITYSPSVFACALACNRDLPHVPPPQRAVMTMTVETARRACDLMRQVWEDSGGADGHVTVDLDPRLASSPALTVHAAKGLIALVGRPNVLVKIPATAEGIEAIEDATAAGISAAATLIFSLDRYNAVAAAYMRGLERLRNSGGDLASVVSVASFEIAAIDAEVDRRLAGDHAKRLRGHMGIAAARLAYQHYKLFVEDARWRALETEGARRQRCLWASTAPDDPAYYDVLYAEELVGSETVSAMTRRTLEAFADHGVVADKIERDLDDAARTCRDIRDAGVVVGDASRALEAAAMRRLLSSFEDLSSS